MNPVESPEQGDFMVEKMPDVKNEIHEDQCCKELSPRGKPHHVEHTQLMGCDVHGRRNNGTGKHQLEYQAVEHGEDYVVNPTFRLGDGTLSVGCQYFQNQKTEDTSPEQRTPNE
jgi:hypothetical protein